MGYVEEIVQQIVYPVLNTFIIVAIFLELYLPFVSFSWAKANGWLKYWAIKPTIIILFIGYSVYTAIYPRDDFYYREFKKVTLRETPESARVIRKSASYPDVHGDYCSAAIIEFSKDDFQKLIGELKRDTVTFKISNGTIGSSVFYEVVIEEEIEKVEVYFQRDVEGYGHHYYIGFMKDGRTVLITVCDT